VIEAASSVIAPRHNDRRLVAYRQWLEYDLPNEGEHRTCRARAESERHRGERHERR
jgi:hypothetical protein